MPRRSDSHASRSRPGVAARAVATALYTDVRNRKRPLDQLIDRSLNETLARTIMTAMTTFLALVALAIFCGPVIRDFTLAMLWGVVIGCYSTVYVASPMILHFKLTRESVGQAPEPA